MANHAHEGCCHSHPGSRLSVAERLRHAEAACQADGARLTPQRRNVLEVLLEAGVAMGAYDMIEALAKRTAKRVAPITIYRALDFLVETGLVHRIESRNAFLACPGAHAGHGLAVFLICNCCGRVDEATSPALEKQLGGIAADHGFRPQGRIIEMAGFCADCAPPAGAGS